MGNETSTLASSQRGERAAARRKKKDQGYHECEVLCKDFELAESEATWNECTKNRGHPNFIPASEFCLDHLPEKFRHRGALRYVKTISALTVRLRVGYTSWGRPDRYTFSQHRGTYITHTGSGLVCDIVERDGPCQCSVCMRSSTPSRYQKWYEIHLETALHVIFNTEEAQETMVDFFYDDKNSLEDGRKKTLWSTEVKHTYEDGDFCSFVCLTHDHNLACKLQRYLKKSTKTMFYGLNGMAHSSSDYVCVMASHPHGQPKKITIGSLNSEREITPLHRYFTYIVDTCPGSSGARGAIVERDIIDKRAYWSLRLLPPHSEATMHRELNRSAASVAGYAQSANPFLVALCEKMEFKTDLRGLVSGFY